VMEALPSMRAIPRSRRLKEKVGGIVAIALLVATAFVAVASQSTRLASPVSVRSVRATHVPLRRFDLKRNTFNSPNSRRVGLRSDLRDGTEDPTWAAKYSDDEKAPVEEGQSNEVKCPGCGKVGGPDWGCNGEGNQLGGLGLFIPWWPIKVYRPCPEYLASGGSYEPAGQGVEEILFGSKKNDPTSRQRGRD